MNAVERLWRALGRRDWDSAEAQMHDQAIVEWPHKKRRGGGGRPLTPPRFASGRLLRIAAVLLILLRVTVLQC